MRLFRNDADNKMNVNECPETSYERRRSAGDNPRKRHKKKKKLVTKNERVKGNKDKVRAVTV